MYVTSCATLGYAAFDLVTAVTRIAARGFRRIEITELGSYCRHYPHQACSWAEVRDLLERHQLTAIAMNVSFSRLVDGSVYRPRLNDPQEAKTIVDQAAWFIREAAALGVSVLSFPIGPRVMDGRWHDDMKASVLAYRRIAETARAHGVGLNLEVPHLYQLTDSIEHVKAIFAKLEGTGVGATVDSSHWGIIGYDMDEFLTFLGPRLRHIHLRDSAGNDTRDFRQNLELTPGQGRVDFASLGRALDKVGYCGDVSLELEHRHREIEVIEREFDAGIDHLIACGWTIPETVVTRGRANAGEI